jgi:hypothetical protein
LARPGRPIALCGVPRPARTVGLAGQETSAGLRRGATRLVHSSAAASATTGGRLGSVWAGHDVDAAWRACAASRRAAGLGSAPLRRRSVSGWVRQCRVGVAVGRRSGPSGV